MPPRTSKSLIRAPIHAHRIETTRLGCDKPFNHFALRGGITPLTDDLASPPRDAHAPARARGSPSTNHCTPPFDDCAASRGRFTPRRNRSWPDRGDGRPARRRSSRASGSRARYARSMTRVTAAIPAAEMRRARNNVDHQRPPCRGIEVDRPLAAVGAILAGQRRAAIQAAVGCVSRLECREWGIGSCSEMCRHSVLGVGDRRAPSNVGLRRSIQSVWAGGHCSICQLPGNCHPRRIAINRSPKQRAAPASVTAVDGTCIMRPMTTTPAPASAATA
jgi:hypothetical protein